MRWEDDGLWASDPAAEEVGRLLDAICPHCDRPWNECDCAERDPRKCPDWLTDESHENGQYNNVCSSCGNQFRGHKRRVTCRMCWRAELDRWCEAAKSWGTYTEDIEAGNAKRHARPDDSEWIIGDIDNYEDLRYLRPDDEWEND